jgi:cold shock CspA family protein
MLGTVRFYDSVKDFGYIIPDDGSRDVRINRGVAEEFLVGDLDAGDRIEFEVVLNKDGRPRAAALKRLGRPIPKRRNLR